MTKQLRANEVEIRSYRPEPRHNAMKVDLGPIALWFSYSTPVAVFIPGKGLIVRENDWGPTTGQHLNIIDGGDKADRVTGEEFERILNSITISVTLPDDKPEQ